MTADVTSPAQERLPDLIVATSSSALFDMSDSDRVFREEGVAAYRRYQVAREDSPLAPGAAFSFVSAYLCIYLFLSWISRIGMLPFVIYRLALGVILLWFVFA